MKLNKKHEKLPNKLKKIFCFSFNKYYLIRTIFKLIIMIHNLNQLTQLILNYILITYIIKIRY